MLIALVLCFSLAACGSKQAEGTDNSTVEQVETATDTTAVAAAEDLTGYWASEDGTIFEVGNGSGLFLCEGITGYGNLIVLELEDIAIDGDRLTFSQNSNTFIYELSKASDRLSLHFLADESSADNEAYREICKDFTVYRESATVELTADNWQDYFEFRPDCNHITDSFGEFKSIDYAWWEFLPKADACVIDVENGAVEVNLKGQNYCWYTYDFATGVLTQGRPAAEGEVNENKYTYAEDRTTEFEFWKSGSNVCSIERFYAAVEPILTESDYSFLGTYYDTIEITRIRGTLTVVG